MSAAVAQRNSPHMPRSSPRNQSPMDKKNVTVKTEEKAKKDSPLSTKQETTSPPRPVEPKAVAKPPVEKGTDSKDAKPAASNAEATTTQPLAPPPRPSQANAASDPDYFSGQHNNAHYSLEPNLFEQSFTNPPETPGKSLLPPVASLTSPAPLTGNASLGGGYNWTSSLRSGPLSPAMLSEPQGPRDYFDTSLRGSFPTPNESSLRTGLTPGGGGSMFPAPSPNSQALFQSLASGGATPNTLDFHRTALNAAATHKTDGNFAATTTSQPQAGPDPAVTMDAARQSTATANGSNGTTQPFALHDNEAANGLYLLAQAGNESQSSNQFAVPPQPAHVNSAQESKRTRNAAGSVGSSAQAPSELSGEHSDGDAKASSRKSKRASAGKGAKVRKADETPSKQPTAKKAKTNASTSIMDMDMDSDQEEIKEETHDENGRKMTDEEKRKNFLERNRVAALKCRQRKKQWLANLQAKVEIFSTENDALTSQVNSLREEILNLKTILIAHKDCPIAQQQQNIGSYVAHGQPEYANHPNPYGMSMQGQPVMAGHRRYS